MVHGSISRQRGHRYVISFLLYVHSTVGQCCLIDFEQLNAIPTVGYSGILTSYITAFKWTHHATELLQEGYNRVRGYLVWFQVLS